MTKVEFLKILENNLQGFSIEEKKDILYDYEEHFTLGKSNGYTEEEIIEELGDPFSIAKQYTTNKITTINENKYSKEDTSGASNQSGPRYNENKNPNYSYSYTPNKPMNWLILIILIPFIILPGGGLLVGILGTILGILASGVGIIISGILLALGGILGTTFLGFEMINIPNAHLIPMPAFLFAGVGLAALGGLFFLGGVYLFKYILLLCSKFFGWIGSLLRR